MPDIQSGSGTAGVEAKLVAISKVFLDAVDWGVYVEMNRVDGYEQAVRNVKAFVVSFRRAITTAG